MHSTDELLIALLVLICSTSGLTYVLLYLLYIKLNEIRKEQYVISMMEKPAAGYDHHIVTMTPGSLPATPVGGGSPARGEASGYEPPTFSSSKHSFAGHTRGLSNMNRRAGSDEDDSAIVKVDELEDINDFSDTMSLKSPS
jgi:hypothetical protein